MSSISTSFKVRLKMLTPLHIGSGETLSRLDYFIEGKMFYRVNMDSLFSDPAFASQRQQFLQAAPGGQPVDQLVPKVILKRHIMYSIPISNSALGTNLIEVRAFIKSAGRLYIPGSSLKGALLSALVYDQLRKSPETAGFRCNDLLGNTLPQLGGSGSGIFTHWLDVSDSNLQTPEKTLELSLARVQGAKRRGTIPILYETLKPGTEWEFTFKLDPNSRLTPQSLIAAVNAFYQKVAKKDDPRKPAPANSGLIRLGQGSGMFATSLLILTQELNLTDIYRRYRIDIRIGPRTRKRIDTLGMGWAQMSIVKEAKNVTS